MSSWPDLLPQFCCRARGLLMTTGSSGCGCRSATNGKDDHQFLARLAVAIAGRYGGIIDLGGVLPVPPPPGVSVLSALETGTSRHLWEDFSRATLATLSGRWYEIPYRTALDDVAVRHVVDVDLLASWLQHPLFRMVK
jgi:hypothetical protein